MAFSYKATFTVTSNSALLPATQTDYPLLVSVTDNALKSAANGGPIVNTDAGRPADFGFYSDTGLTTLLDFEVKFWNPVTGELVAFVKIPSLALGTVFYAGMGDAAIATFQGDINGTWISAYKAVIHMPDGTTLTANDSTSGANHGTNTDATAVVGQIGGGAADFNGISARITLANEANFDFNCDQTWSYQILYKAAAANPSLIGTLLSKQGSDGAGGSRGFSLFIRGDTLNDPFEVQMNNLSATLAAVVRFPRANDVNWHLITVTNSGNGQASGVKLYDNATEQTPTVITNSLLGQTILTNELFTIGRRPGFTDLYFVGSGQEVRVRNDVLTANWITADHNSLSDNATFVAKLFESLSGDVLMAQCLT